MSSGNKQITYMKQMNRKYCILGIGVLVSGLALSANATISYQISNAGLETTDVSFDGTSYNGVLAGGIGISGSDGSSYVSLCTDFLGSLYLGSTYSYNSPVSVGSSGLTGIAPAWGADNAGKTGGAIDQTSATYGLDNAASLFLNNLSVLKTGTTDQKAALQIAVWTALYDTTSTGTLDLTDGRFDFSADTGLDSDVLAYLNGLVNPTSAGYTTPAVDLLVPSPATAANGNNPDGQPPQELLIPSSTTQVVQPVPEASTIVTGALLLLSFGLCSLKSFGKSRV